jgi:predicted signal transduction protein with EAL and GGDEF domain
MIFFGPYSFLEIRIAKPLWIGGAVVWMAGFAALATAGVKDYILIVCVNASLFLMALRIGISMIRVGRRQRRLAHFLGVLNLAWVLCAVLSSYVFSLNQLFVYVVMHGIRFANAIGLIQMSFGAQKGKIESGFARIKRLLERDELTGLHNKTYFDEKIRALDQSADCLPVSLLFGDMNGLKFVNDAFGHQEATAGSKEPRAFFRKPAARGTSSRGGAGTNSR